MLYLSNAPFKLVNISFSKCTKEFKIESFVDDGIWVDIVLLMHGFNVFWSISIFKWYSKSVQRNICRCGEPLVWNCTCTKKSFMFTSGGLLLFKTCFVSYSHLLWKAKDAIGSYLTSHWWPVSKLDFIQFWSSGQLSLQGVKKEVGGPRVFTIARRFCKASFQYAAVLPFRLMNM